MDKNHEQEKQELYTFLPERESHWSFVNKDTRYSSNPKVLVTFNKSSSRWVCTLTFITFCTLLHCNMWIEASGQETERREETESVLFPRGAAAPGFVF